MRAAKVVRAATGGGKLHLERCVVAQEGSDSRKMTQLEKTLQRKQLHLRKGRGAQLQLAGSGNNPTC